METNYNMKLFVLLFLLSPVYEIVKCKPLTLLDRINALGVRITQCIVNPSNSNGKQLLKDVCRYYVNLDKLFNLLCNSDETKNERGKTIYKALVEQGGPSWLLITIDYEILKQAYKWKHNFEINHLKEAKSEIEQLWVSVLELGEEKEIKNVKVQK